jgi:monofunctional biosynthetic peptidoglycan transglycosylase
MPFLKLPRHLSLLLLCALILAVLGLAASAWWRAQGAALPALGPLDDDAWVMAQVGLDAWTPLDAISPLAMAAVLAGEDDRFFEHKGVDTREAWQALRTDLKALRYKRGAGTLTMQVARNVYLGREKTLSRKAKEYQLAEKMEKRFDKRRILEVYLNIAEWGPQGERGIGAASRIYFAKPPADLSPKEACFLAMLLPNPRRYSESFTRRKLTRFAQRRVKALLQGLAREGLLSEAEVQAEMAKPLSFEASPAR